MNIIYKSFFSPRLFCHKITLWKSAEQSWAAKNKLIAKNKRCKETKITALKILNNLDTLMSIEYSLDNYHRSNQDTCLVNKPSVFEGQWVESGDLLADCSTSVGGELSLGQNILIAYMPWEGYNFEDAILISERLVFDDLYTSIHIEKYEVEIQDTKLGIEEITREIPDIHDESIKHLDSSGIAKLGSWVEEGDILIGKVTPISKKSQSNYQKLLYTILEKPVLPVRDSSFRAPKGIKAKVVGIQIFKKNKNSQISNFGGLASLYPLNTAYSDSVPPNTTPLNQKIDFQSLENKKDDTFKIPKFSVSKIIKKSEKKNYLKNKAPLYNYKSHENPILSKINFGNNPALEFGSLPPSSQKQKEGGKEPSEKISRLKSHFFSNNIKIIPKKSSLYSPDYFNLYTNNFNTIDLNPSQIIKTDKLDIKKKEILKTIEKVSHTTLNQLKGPYFYDSDVAGQENNSTTTTNQNQLIKNNWIKSFSSPKKKRIDIYNKIKSDKSKISNTKNRTSGLYPRNLPLWSLPHQIIMTTQNDNPGKPCKQNNSKKNQNKKNTVLSAEQSWGCNWKEKEVSLGGKVSGKEVIPILKEKKILNTVSSIQIYLAEKRRTQIGDKMAGRHGNKGIISQILPLEDMPFLPDGTPLDMVLNPLGVPSRMNVGQIYECLLGFAGKYLGENFKVFPFDEIYGAEASRSFVYSKLYDSSVKTGKKWLFNPNTPGKMRLYDGRTGEPFDTAATVGYAYMLRLVHMVDDKIHARSTGPYSLVTQQPLRGRSKQGGQRLGEMEVWALEGYGAAFTLLEMLTIKSDDMSGRMTLWSNLILNKEISIGTPESFKVLICELQALCLDIGLFRENSERKDPFSNLFKAPESELAGS